MRFSEILRSMTPVDGGMSVDFHELWLQGRTVFGGLQAAALVRAMRAHAGPDVPLRSLQVSFVAPVPAGRALVTTRLLRQGKSVTHVDARITIDGQDACVGVGIFGAARESKLAIVPPRPVATAKPESDSKPLPFIPGRSPAFAQHVEMRFGAGRFPFTGGAEPKTQIWCRFKDEPGVDEGILIGLADLPPSPAISVLTSIAIASSMTWTLEFLRHDWDPAATSGWLFDLEANAANEGYVAQTGVLWSPDGKAVALSRQSVVVFG
jgi:acyl-CoA thioesterase